MNAETILIRYIVGLLLIAIPFLVWAYRKDKKRMAIVREFQKHLKTGTETDRGVVIRIEGDNVVTEIYTPIKYVWPPEKRKK